MEMQKHGSVLTEKGERTMPDRAKVIKGLKCCCGTDMCFYRCPYHDASKKITECTSQLALEALDLLKEQEEQIKNRDESLEKAREEIKWLRGMLKEQEAVVRCKDCENGAYVAAPGMLPFVKCGGIDHELDWFCADGKQR